MRSYCRRTERIYKRITRWLSVAPSRLNAGETEESLDKLPGRLCYFLQGRPLHPYLPVSVGLTGATEQKHWHLVSTNEKWQMHKSFRLCRVERYQFDTVSSCLMLRWWELPTGARGNSCRRWRAERGPALLFKPQTYFIITMEDASVHLEVGPRPESSLRLTRSGQPVL